ncbi:SDR family NAD(P)-dependent oxidoreductase [Solwaraspora sp. WMMD1047]|uniref:SDR family NAD(P)-dependent oxidoreductase n=1 Tax=Solwaraspora sp. WMMD1047 TaxID=3016102 RepID=UPI00241732C8|nr:SDR family NAD(P)-dependent oxidoreductase [Solwaraspora sp. WMMD1047]MDG4834322.1 SDR family NAD(P)-dependent oxidoreductase [Solwaraspora sp. WMMD1047]
MTGAANGLGREIALGLVADGWTVAALDIDKPALDALCAEADGLRPFVVDVRDRAAVRDAVARMGPAGALHGLVNNAGVIRVAPILEMSAADWTDVLDVNLTGAFHVAQAVGARMVAEEVPGRLINMGTISGKVPRPGRSSYCVSKTAVTMLTRMLAVELAPARVTVNTVSPGSAEGGVVWENIAKGHTTMAALVGGDLARHRLGVPLGRLANAQDVLGAVRYLLSPAAGHVTGVELPVDGGQGMF